MTYYRTHFSLNVVFYLNYIKNVSDFEWKPIKLPLWLKQLYKFLSLRYFAAATKPNSPCSTKIKNSRHTTAPEPHPSTVLCKELPQQFLFLTFRLSRAEHQETIFRRVWCAGPEWRAGNMCSSISVISCAFDSCRSSWTTAALFALQNSSISYGEHSTYLKKNTDFRGYQKSQNPSCKRDRRKPRWLTELL